VTDQLFSHLNSLSLQKPIVLASKSFSLEELSLSDDEPDMTSAETENAKIHSLLLNVVVYIGGDKSIGGSNVEKLLSQVEEWLRSTKERLASESNDSRCFTDTTIRLSGVETESLRAPSWVYLHENFSLLETLKAISQVVVVSSKQSNPTRKIAKSRLEILQSLVNGIYESIKKNTRSLKERLAEAGVLGKLIELVLSGGGGSHNEGEVAMHQYLEETLNASELEVFCGKLMESWEDGLEGILGIVSK
jgi:N-terminal acetyltransferase B complex non-catalytic subunit